MQQLIIAAAVGFLVGVIVVGIPAIVFIKLRERGFQQLSDGFQQISDHYERIIEASDDRVASGEDRLGQFLDRFYKSQNLPPGDVDMLAEHKERREREREQREQGRRRYPAKIGQVDQAQDAMAQAVASGQYSQTK